MANTLQTLSLSFNLSHTPLSRSRECIPGQVVTGTTAIKSGDKLIVWSPNQSGPRNNHQRVVQLVSLSCPSRFSTINIFNHNDHVLSLCAHLVLVVMLCPKLGTGSLSGNTHTYIVLRWAALFSPCHFPTPSNATLAFETYHQLAPKRDLPPRPRGHHQPT